MKAEFNKIPKKTLMEIYRHYYVDYIMFDIEFEDNIEINNKRKPHSELYRRKEMVIIPKVFETGNC